MTGQRNIIQVGRFLSGMSYSEGRLYTLEGCGSGSGTHSQTVAVYSVHRDSAEITLLDRLELWETGIGWQIVCPRVDHHSQHVFVPSDSGVAVARLDGDRLVRERTLTCVSVTVSVDVMSPDTVYVCDSRNKSVHVVDVRNDRITSTLQRPDITRDEVPARLAVLGDSVVVCYSGNCPLVVYRHGSPAPVRVIPHPLTESNFVRVVSTDYQRHVLLADETFSKVTVSVLNISGDLYHTINFDKSDKFEMIQTDYPVDCAVVNRQLWVGFSSGYIVKMSSQ